MDIERILLTTGVIGLLVGAWSCMLAPLSEILSLTMIVGGLVFFVSTTVLIIGELVEIWDD